MNENGEVRSWSDALTILERGLSLPSRMILEILGVYPINTYIDVIGSVPALQRKLCRLATLWLSARRSLSSKEFLVWIRQEVPEWDQATPLDSCDDLKALYFESACQLACLQRVLRAIEQWSLEHQH